MKASIVDRILELNRIFYQQNAESFSKSRRKYWGGWDKVIEIESQNTEEPLKVLDLACGNCRFYGFLRDKLKKPFTYKGVDSNKELLKIASDAYGQNNNFKTSLLDVILNLNEIKDSYDLVVGFGITHHIPSEKLRTEFFENLGRPINRGGVLVLTFWEFNNKNTKIPDDIEQGELEKGDMFLSWNNQKESFRYVHRYSLDEIEKIINIMQGQGFSKITQFIDDINKKSDNLYLVFKKS